MATTPVKPAASPPFPKTTPVGDSSKSPSELIAARIASLDDWRGDLLAALRKVIGAADPGVIEEWKWNVPVWSCHGIICTGEAYKKAVKLTFAKGASLPDPTHLFNSSLDGNVRRAIDFTEGSAIREQALAELVRAAIRHNRSSAKLGPGSAA